MKQNLYGQSGRNYNVSARKLKLQEFEPHENLEYNKGQRISKRGKDGALYYWN